MANTEKEFMKVILLIITKGKKKLGINLPRKEETAIVKITKN